MTRKIIALDWHATIRLHKIIYMTYPIYLFLVGFGMSQILIIPFSLWMALSCAANPFAAEEKGEFNQLFLTLPISRYQIVKARFIFSLVMMFIGIVIGVAFVPIVRYFSSYLWSIWPVSLWYIGFEGYVAITGVSVLLFAILHIFMFPFLYKMGYQRGKILGVYLPAVLFGFLFISYSVRMMVSARNFTFEYLILARENMLLVCSVLFALSALLLFVSYKLSQKIYSKRDL